MNRVAMICWGAALVAGVTAVHLWREVRVEQTRHADLAARVVALETAAAEAARPGAAPAAATVDVQEPAAIAQPSAPRAQSGGREVNPLAAMARQLTSTPEGREFQLSITRQSLFRQFAGVQKELGLTAQEMDRFIDLLARQRTDVGTERLRQMSGAAADRAAIEEAGRRLAQMEQDYEAEMAALLGSRYDGWKQYQRNSASRQQELYASQAREQMRAAIDTRSNPLSDAMFEPLSKALADEQRRIDQEQRAMSMQAQVQRLPQTQQRLIDVASAYLNADQLQRYRRHLEDQAEEMNLMIGVLDAAGGAQAPAVAPDGGY